MMNQQHKISVIIPCYNAGKYIIEAVDSIINQTYRNLEILLIDDGSSDDTKSIIANYAIQDARIIPIYNENDFEIIGILYSRDLIGIDENILLKDSGIIFETPLFLH